MKTKTSAKCFFNTVTALFVGYTEEWAPAHTFAEAHSH